MVHEELRAIRVLIVFIECMEEHAHGLCGCGSLIEQGCIGKWQRSKVADHGLEVEQAFEAALAYLGLVGRILCVPARVLKNIAQDNAGCVGIVVALSYIILANFIL